MKIYLGAVSGTNLENDLCVLWHLCLIMFFLVIRSGCDFLSSPSRQSSPVEKPSLSGIPLLLFVLLSALLFMTQQSISFYESLH